MVNPLPIAQDIYWIGVNDFETDLFEALWPLPYGITYNSYLIKDQKIAIIDTVKSEFYDTYIQKIQSILPQGKNIDYLIVNHMEPDHSGSVKLLLETYPSMQIIGNKKTAEFLQRFYNITDRIITVVNDQTISLGIHVLNFKLTPMVHWPETMMTYDSKEHTIFSGDVFGGFGAFKGPIFDDEVNIQFYEYEILRYFSNIIGKYSTMVTKAIASINHFDIKIVAPTHGPIFRKKPNYIINAYNNWSNYKSEPGATIVYGSMYNNTEKMAQVIARTCTESGVPVSLRNVSKEHISYAIADSWKYTNLFIGTPTYNTRIFPPVEQFITSLDDKFLRSRTISIFGSYTWSGGGVKKLTDLALAGKWNLLEPVIEVKSSPSEMDLESCKSLVNKAFGQTSPI